jgi:predicted O-linked N-acetylglucosamine transferase (SPINDLY family)
MSTDVQHLIGQAIQEFESGKPDRAKELLLVVLEAEEDNVIALEIISFIESSLGNFTSAKSYLLSLLNLNPNSASGYRLLGVNFAQQKDWVEALAYISKAIDINQNDQIAYSTLANVFAGLENYDKAIDACNKAISIDPNYPEAWLNKGNIFYKLQNYQEAINSFNKAITLDAIYVEAISNKANALTHLKKYEEAITLYESAILIKPKYVEAWINKASCYGLMQYYSDALKCVQHAISMNSNYAEAWITLGKIYAETNFLEDSLKSYQQALKLRPESPFLEGLIFRLKENLGNWENFEQERIHLSQNISKQKKAVPPHALLSILDNPELQLQAAKIWTQYEHPQNFSLGPPQKFKHSKIKIAYFSADFKDHPVTYLTTELFELHDRERFEVYGFSLKRANNSPVRQRLVSAFDHFIEVDDKSDLEIAQLARNLEIDIAIDLGGHTQDSRTGVFALRAAPIQVNYLGFAGTMGAEYIDYLIADRVIIPEQYQAYYLEKKVYLPNSYMVDDSSRLPSNQSFQRSDFGLPESGVIFCCFNNSYKFNPPRIASFAKILAGTPNSVLWVSENNASFQKNLLAEFNKLGIPESRIIFAGRIEALADHLARYRVADLFLDTSPYNAHTTAVDSLKAGTPVISLAGKTYASRAGASLLTAIGLPELITSSEEEFIKLAIVLGNDPLALSSLKERLKANYQMMPLFNSKRFCSHLESAYQEMHRKDLNNLPPADIFISQ